MGPVQLNFNKRVGARSAVTERAQGKDINGISRRNLQKSRFETWNLAQLRRARTRQNNALQIQIPMVFEVERDHILDKSTGSESSFT